MTPSLLGRSPPQLWSELTRTERDVASHLALLMMLSPRTPAI